MIWHQAGRAPCPSTQRAKDEPRAAGTSSSRPGYTAAVRWVGTRRVRLGEGAGCARCPRTGPIDRLGSSGPPERRIGIVRVARATDWDRQGHPIDGLGAPGPPDRRIGIVRATRSTDWERQGHPIDGLGSPGDPKRRIGQPMSTLGSRGDPKAGSVRAQPVCHPIDGLGSPGSPDRRIGIARVARSTDWDRQAIRNAGSVNPEALCDRVAIRNAGSVRRAWGRRAAQGSTALARRTRRAVATPGTTALTRARSRRLLRRLLGRRCCSSLRRA